MPLHCGCRLSLLLLIDTECLQAPFCFTSTDAFRLCDAHSECSDLLIIILSTILLGHKRACCRALVSPRRCEHTYALVVAGEAVNSRFDENETEFAVLVFSVALEMFAYGDGLDEGG